MLKIPEAQSCKSQSLFYSIYFIYLLMSDDIGGAPTHTSNPFNQRPHLYWHILWSTHPLSSESVSDCTAMAKRFENDTNMNFHKVCWLSFYYDNLHIFQNVMSMTRWIAINGHGNSQDFNPIENLWPMWTNQISQIPTNSKPCLCRNGLPVRMWSGG